MRVSGTKLELLEPSIQVRTSPISADREGNLWLGTNGEGLVRFKDRPVRIFTKADGLPNNVPMTVLSTRDGNLWVIEKGLNPGDRIVVEGLQRVKSGMKVAPKEAAAEPAAATTPAAAAAKEPGK